MPNARRVLLVAGLAGGFAASAAAQERTFERTLELQPGGRLALAVDRGSVRLTSWDRPSAEIVARIEPPPGVGAEQARQAVDAVSVEVRGNRRSVRIRTDYDRGGAPPGGQLSGRRSARVHYEIRAPRQLDLDLDVDRADTTLEGFEGRLLLDADRSDVDVRDLAGAVTLEFDRGTLRARGLAGSIVVELDRASEAVLEGLRGGLHLDADRTSVALRDLAVEDDSAVEIDRGDLDVELAADAAVTIAAAATRRSSFSSDVPGMLESQGGGVAFRGDVDGGGPVLRIEAHRGAVHLRMRR